MFIDSPHSFILPLFSLAIECRGKCEINRDVSDHIYIYIANFEIISTINFKNYLSEMDLHDKKNF